MGPPIKLIHVTCDPIVENPTVYFTLNIQRHIYGLDPILRAGHHRQPNAFQQQNSKSVYMCTSAVQMKAVEFFENYNYTVLISAEMAFLLDEATCLSEKIIT